MVTPTNFDTNQADFMLNQKPLRHQTRRPKWKSQQNISFSTIGNPYPTNHQFQSQHPSFNLLQPTCQQYPTQRSIILNASPLATAGSCCLHQQQDPFGNIYFVPQKSVLDLGLCRGCRRLYAASPMIQNISLAGVSVLFKRFD